MILAKTIERSDRAQGGLYVAAAAVAWSSAGVIQRSLSVDPATQLVGRAGFAMLAILVFVLATERGATFQSFRMGRTELTFAVAMAVSSGCFILALNETTVANVVMLQATAPLLAAALGQLFLRESVGGRSWLAMGGAVVGVGLMIGGPGGELSLGVVLAGITAVAFSVSIVAARRRLDRSMAPASCLGQLLLVICVVPLSHFSDVGTHDLLLLAALGFGQIGLGLIFLTLGARRISAADVALISLLEIVLGPLWVWLARSEVPSLATLVGGLVILISVVLGTLRAPRPAPAVT